MIRCIKISAFLLLCCYNLLLHAENNVNLTVDWKTFLARHDLIWEQTPDNYFNAPFLGNGLLGALLYQPKNELLRLDIGSSEVLEHRHSEARSIVDNGRLPIGYFELATNYPLKIMKGRLHLYDAEALFNLSMYKQQSATLTLKVLRNTDLIIVDLKPSNGLQTFWTFRPIPSVVPRKEPIDGSNYLNPPPIFSSYKDIQICTQKRTSGGDYVTAWKEISLPNGTKRLFVTIKDDYPQITDLEQLNKLITYYCNETNYNLAEKRHKDWWHDYYSKSFISIPHPQMESLYWGLQYKLASMIRKGAPLCDLMGPWYKSTSWPGIWMNLNTQMLFSSLHIANQLELASTLSDYIFEKENDLIKSVPKEFQYNSAGLVRCTGREQIDPVFTWPNAEYPERSNLIYLLYYMWEHYRMIIDDHYLKEKYYPLLKRAVNFLINALEEDEQGRLHTPKAHSPESTNGKDTNYDLSSLRWGCQTLLAINQRLKLKDPEQKTWNDVLNRLIDYPADSNGYMTAAGQPAPLMHRHWCHLFQIYPYYLANYDHPEEHDIILRSINHWGNPKIPNTWTQAVISSMYSSMQMGTKALEHLNLALATRNLSSTFMHAEGGSPCSETYGGLSRMLLDMLIQSWNGKIRIFPGVAPEWQEAVFYHLRAEGGFLVSANRKNGATEWIEIESLAGEPCILEHGFDKTFHVEGCKMKQINDHTIQLYLKKNEKAFIYAGKHEIKNLQPIMIKDGSYNFYGWPDKRNTQK